jgi:hypothetical protein
MFNDKLNLNHTFGDMSDAELAAEVARLRAELGH